MNYKLTTVILEHVLLNLGLNKENNSIFNNLFLLDDQIIEYVDEFDQNQNAPIYSCQVRVNNSNFQIMATKLLTDNHKSYYEDIYLIIKLEGCPIYGCYLSVFNDTLTDEDNQDYHNGFIACFIDNKNWVPAPVFIQGTFLAGMEQLKELSVPFTKNDNSEDLLNNLKSFIAYQESYLDNEGQENRY